MTSARLTQLHSPRSSSRLPGRAYGRDPPTTTAPPTLNCTADISRRALPPGEIRDHRTPPHGDREDSCPQGLCTTVDYLWGTRGQPVQELGTAWGQRYGTGVDIALTRGDAAYGWWTKIGLGQFPRSRPAPPRIDRNPLRGYRPQVHPPPVDNTRALCRLVGAGFSARRAEEVAARAPARRRPAPARPGGLAGTPRSGFGTRPGPPGPVRRCPGRHARRGPPLGFPPREGRRGLLRLHPALPVRRRGAAPLPPDGGPW